MNRALPYVSWMSSWMAARTILWLQFFASAAVLSPVTAAAQPGKANAIIVPEPGARVRVSLPTLPDIRQQRITGTLASLTRDSVRVAIRPGDTATVALDALEKFEVSLGQRRPVLSSIGAGALIGGGLLAVIAASAESDSCTGEYGCLLEFSRGEAAAIGGVFGAVTGALIGGIVGAMRVTDRWQPVATAPLRSRVVFEGMSLTPPLGRPAGLAVRLRF